MLNSLRRMNEIAGILAVFLCLFLASSTPAAAFEQERPPAEKSLGPLEKSLLLPGWGQFSEKRYIEGAAFLAAEAVCLYGVFANDHLGNLNYDLYKSAASTDDAVRFRQLVEKYDGRRNRFLLAAAAVWAANLVDIYLIVKNKGKTDKGFSFRIERGGHQKISFTAACRF
ncbi:MAG: hypothetical protein ABSF88_00440 [Candidatus Aminicenantales bacterium]